MVSNLPVKECNINMKMCYEFAVTIKLVEIIKGIGDVILAYPSTNALINSSINASTLSINRAMVTGLDGCLCSKQPGYGCHV